MAGPFKRRCGGNERACSHTSRKVSLKTVDVVPLFGLLRVRRDSAIAECASSELERMHHACFFALLRALDLIHNGYHNRAKINVELVRGVSAVSARRTQLLEDQLDHADAGRRWQIADRRRCSGGATWKAAARGTSVRELRVRFVVEP